MVGSTSSLDCVSTFDAILAEVTGAGPGISLAKKVTHIEADVNAGDIADACDTLAGFVHEVQAQIGKKHSVGDPTSLIAGAQGVEAVLGC